MSLSTLSFHVDDAAKSIRRNGLMSLAALTTVAISMAVLGGSLFALHRLHQFAEAQPRQFEVAVFLHTSTSRDAAKAMLEKVEKMPGIAHVTLYGREQALREMEERDRSNNTRIVADLEGENPLPDRLDVRLTDPRDTQTIAAALADSSQFPEVEKVQDARQTLEMLFSLQRIVRNVGITAAALLFLGTAFVIQNTIRLTVVARRREIRIMQLVGATAGFIRFPMLLEGVFYGVAGSALAAGVVLFTIGQISRYAGRFESPLWQNMPAPASPATVVGVLVGLGALIGWTGSLLSIRRFLKRA